MLQSFSWAFSCCKVSEPANDGSVSVAEIEDDEEQHERENRERIVTCAVEDDYREIRQSRILSKDEIAQICAFRDQYTEPAAQDRDQSEAAANDAMKSIPSARVRFFTAEEEAVLGCSPVSPAEVVALQQRATAAVAASFSLSLSKSLQNIEDEMPVEAIEGPWGVAPACGAETNAWSDIDPSAFKVRGADYLSNKQKMCSAGALAELLVADLFMCKHDVMCASQCRAVGTVQRLRQAGEKRRLFVLNFRIVPLHFVVVWALPAKRVTKDAEDCALDLVERFLTMSDKERNKRLKVIPRVIDGPWLARKAVGETPALLGKNIALQYYDLEREFEISVGVASSGAAQKVCRVLVYAAKAVDIELGVLIEGQCPSELPEKLLGGFRVRHPNISSLREVILPDDFVSP